MTAIKPISDLRNYNEVLKECVNGNPVYLTKNGRGKYILLEIETYDEQVSKMKLLKEKWMLSKMGGIQWKI